MGKKDEHWLTKKVNGETVQIRIKEKMGVLGGKITWLATAICPICTDDMSQSTNKSEDAAVRLIVSKMRSHLERKH